MWVWRHIYRWTGFRFEWELSHRRKDRVTTRSIFGGRWETWWWGMEEDYTVRHDNAWQGIKYHLFGKYKNGG